MKIGIFGGTFNPIHLAHLRIAEEVRERFALARVLFMPAATPPHKPLAGEVAFADRLAMVELAIAGNPAFATSPLEGERGGTSYLVDSLRQLTAAHPGDELFFLMGSDSFADIGNWREYATYFQLASIVVVERPGKTVAELPATLPAAVRAEFAWEAAAGCLRHTSGHGVYFHCGIHHAVSSSTVRELVRDGRSIRYLVPEAVADYIQRQRLYHDDCRPA